MEGLGSVSSSGKPEGPRGAEKGVSLCGSRNHPSPDHPSPESAALPAHTWETAGRGGHPQATEPGDGAPCKVGTRSHLMLTGTVITSGHEAGTSMVHFSEDTHALGAGLAHGLFRKWADHGPQPSAPCIVSLFSTKAPHVFWGSPPQGRPLP